MFLLDTNVISELRKGKARPSPEVWRWATSVPVHLQYVSVITILEMQYGVLSVGRKDAAQSVMLRSWLDSVLIEFRPRLLDIGAEVALLCAKLHVPDRLPDRDALIAATAIVHGMTVVTRNVADFTRTGVSIINPWEA